MVKQLICVLAIAINIQVQAQENKLAMFDNLVGKVWKADGEWGDGSKFKQEITKSAFSVS